MNEIRYMVTSGFLGAGKTTAMIAFAREIDRRFGKAAILANDLGARNIVDAEFTRMTGLLTEQVTGGCICYQHETLVAKLRALASGGANVIFSDIPGCGIGALDHVYLELKRQEPDEFTLMPFTCIVDPERLRMIMPEQAELNLPLQMRFLLEAQLAEADLIVLNKIDLLTSGQQAQCLDFLRRSYPNTPVYAISAMTGAGVPVVVDYLMTHTAPAVHKDIGYGSEEFIAAEQLLSWYNRRVWLEERDGRPVDFNQVLAELFEEIRRGLRLTGQNVPHLKAFASGLDGDYLKLSMIGVDYPLEYASRLARPYQAVSVVLNARAAADSQRMAQLVDEALCTVAEQYHLRVKTFFLETFGMMEEGNENGAKASRYDG